MRLQVAVDRPAERREEEIVAELGEQAIALEAILHRVFHLGKAQLDAGLLQVVVERRQRLGRRDVDVGHRFGGDDDPLRRRGRIRNRLQDVLTEDLGIGEEQRRVPAEQHQPRNPPRLRIARDVVIAFQPIRRGPAPHRRAATRAR